MSSHFVCFRKPVAIIIVAVLLLLIGGYIYLDNKADQHAQSVFSALKTQVNAAGGHFQYQRVDTSLLSRSITLSNIAIKGNDNEPDITIGRIIVKDLDWPVLLGQKKVTHLPLQLSLTVQDGEIYLKPSLVVQDRDIQALAEHMGNRLRFSLGLDYHYVDSGDLTVTASHTLEDSYIVRSHFILGNMQWLTKVDQKLPHELSADILLSTLKQFELDFQNKGIIEKLRSVAIKRTGMTTEQLTQNAIATMQEIRSNAEKNWGPLFLPMIDQLIKFTQKPDRLRLSLHPNPPLDSDALLLAIRGGNAGVLELIKKSNLTVRANE